MFNSTTTRIPVSNTVTALEVWLLACMLLVFLSLVEYAVILRKIVIHKRKKDVSLGSHNPLCEYTHPSSSQMAGSGSSSNSNNYTTINYNHPQQHQLSDLADNGHPHEPHPGHRSHHRDSRHRDMVREEENCFVQEQYRNLLVHVENTNRPPEIRQRIRKKKYLRTEEKKNGGIEQTLDSPWIKLTKFKTNLDRGATYLFPLMFCVFNLFYWAYYLFITSQNSKMKK